jgi:hypothetical protein
MPRLSPAVPALVAVLTLAACEPQLTPGYDLFGSWAQLDVPVGSPGQQWTFRNDLTYDRTGAESGSGIFFVEGTRLTVQDEAEHLSYEYLTTDSHWLANAAHATGPVSGRVGTFHGLLEDHAADLTIDYMITLRSDRSVYEMRRITGPGRDDVYTGDGTWADAPTGSSFTITVTLSGPAGTIGETYDAWRLGDAIGGPLYERTSF